MIQQQETFNPNNWEPVICVEEGEQAQCDRCKQIVQAKKIGEHMMCDKCGKYIWRKKAK